MLDNRRKFLALSAGVGTLAFFKIAALQGQSRPQRPVTAGSDSSSNSSGDSSDGAVPEKSSTKALLEANEKDIKKNIEKLFQLASDLKTEVEKTDSSQVLSLALLKKADEIEKLAHDIKTRAKG
jgi:hypothetical protein